MEPMGPVEPAAPMERIELNEPMEPMELSKNLTLLTHFGAKTGAQFSSTYRSVRRFRLHYVDLKPSNFTESHRVCCNHVFLCAESGVGGVIR